MSVCLFIDVCKYVCMYLCMYACMYACTHVRAYFLCRNANFESNQNKKCVSACVCFFDFVPTQPNWHVPWGVTNNEARQNPRTRLAPRPYTGNTFKLFFIHIFRLRWRLAPSLLIHQCGMTHSLACVCLDSSMRVATTHSQVCNDWFISPLISDIVSPFYIMSHISFPESCYSILFNHTTSDIICTPSDTHTHARHAIYLRLLETYTCTVRMCQEHTYFSPHFPCPPSTHHAHMHVHIHKCITSHSLLPSLSA